MLLTLLSSLKNDGNGHVVYTLFRPGPLYKDFLREGIRVRPLNLPNPLFIFAVPILLWEIFAKKPDIIESYLLADNIVSRILGKITGTKTISGKRDTDKGKEGWKVFLDKATLGFADLHISNSNAGKKELLAYGVPGNNIRVIHNGKAFPEIPASAGAQFRSKNGISNKDFVLGNIARLQPFKGQEYLIRALPEIISKIPTVKLVLVGGGPDIMRLSELCKRLRIENNVFFAGQLENVYPALCSFDLFVFPSLREGLPGSLMEAMGCGIPCIASRVDGCIELINNESDGILVEPMNPRQISDKVVELYSNVEKRKRIAKKAKKKMREGFSITKMAEAYLDAYSSLADS